MTDSTSIPSSTPNPKPVEGRVKILGLDPSLTSFGVGAVEVKGQTIGPARMDLTWRYTARLLKTSKKGVERLIWFRDSIEALAGQFDLAVVEGYAYGRHNQMAALGELGGLVKIALHETGVPYVIVAPTSLKKFVTGKGNAPKDLIMMEAYKRWEVDVPTTDEADAVALALMGATAVYGLDTGLPKPNMEALKKVEWV